MYKHAFLVFAVAMATASAVERAYDGYYNTIDDGGMDAYGYQMPAAYNSYNNYYNGHDDAELVYAPYHNYAPYPTYHTIHKRSPGLIVLSGAALKGTGKAALAGAPLFGKKALKGLKAAPIAALKGPAFLTKTALVGKGAAKLGGAALLGKTALVAIPATKLGSKGAALLGKTALLGVPGKALGAAGLALTIPVKKAAAKKAGFKAAKFFGKKVLVG